jgi:valyl-tRNA synthetase
MSHLAKAYEPKDVETKWTRFWDEQKVFKADAHSGKPAYSIVMPPPNVTGVLHMGHALVNTLQDVLIRWKRMEGFESLWVPGTDHAGIATQTVVERQLIAKTGKRRKDFSREEFLEHVWAWKNQSENQILSQIKRLGCSCDFSRLCFTMDEQRSLAVSTMFKKMFDAGLIYRGDYLVNWDPVTQTALADDEVEYEERDSFLWHLRYPIEGTKEYLIVATTRPETMLGDTAVAVSPKDERYAKWVGKQIRLPLSNRLVPIVADPFVDASFGTGAVKITPAHDRNDYEMAARQQLEYINIMTPDGRINDQGGEFAGLTMEEARHAVVAKLKSLNLLEKIQPHPLRVGVSYRSKAVIEPYLSKQWFVRMEQFKPLLRDAVAQKKVTLVPEHWESTYFHWIDNLRDWCISRQLWWGHRIPIWYNVENPEKMVCAAGVDLPAEVAKNPAQWRQDEDVLDTWFSSALWPFSVFGWPEKTADLEKFYPTSVLVTGHDILFFWVARMILMGEYGMGSVPFAKTFIHGLIYGKSYWTHQKDGSIAYIGGEERLSYDLGKPVPAHVHFKWEKMSKSKGNIIDPIEMIDTYGADALRMALCSSATHATQIDLDRRRFEEFKNFANKVWNGARFVLLNIESLTPQSLAEGLDLNDLQLEDRWILSLLNRTIAEVSAHLETYAFDKAANAAYTFFWKEFCAYYVELTKPTLFGKSGTAKQKENKQKILLIVLNNCIRLLHPMAPFITEELFLQLKTQFQSAEIRKHTLDPYTLETLTAFQAAACATAPYPRLIRDKDISAEIEEQFAFLDTVVHAVRTIRAEMQLSPGAATDLYVVGKADETHRNMAFENQSIITALVRINHFHFVDKEVELAFSANAVVGNLKLIIPLPEEMREKERVRLEKEKERLILEQNKLREQLANEGFMQKAPPQLVQKIKDGLEQSEKGLASVVHKLEQM